MNNGVYSRLQKAIFNVTTMLLIGFFQSVKVAQVGLGLRSELYPYLEKEVNIFLTFKIHIHRPQKSGQANFSHKG